FSTPFRKHGVVSLATYMSIYKKGDTVDIKGKALFKKECPSVTQHAVAVVMNKQVKGKIPAMRVSVLIEHIKRSKSRDGFLKQVKENDPMEAKERGTWAQLKRPACPTQRSTVCESRWKEPELAEPSPCECTA
ncbi:hypothetical protein PANDA_014649, partial [Ailuropoda melanoleuca]